MRMVDFGEKIRALRLERNISRPDFCGDESELSVRQLMRIENGESKPTLSKLRYIAERLGIEDYKIMPDYKELDRQYLELKYFLMRTPIYENEEIAKEKERIFDEITEKYYDDLPEEEKLVMDILQAYVDFTWWDDDSNVGLILQDYFSQVQCKQTYTANDMLLVNLYFTKLVHDATAIDEKERANFIALFHKVFDQASSFEIEYSFLMRDSLLLTLGVFEKIGDYSFFEPIFSKLEEITSKTYDFQKKPIIRLWEWRYALFEKNDYSSADKYYQEARLYASTMENPHLQEQLEKQWQLDLQEFFNKSSKK